MSSGIPPRTLESCCGTIIKIHKFNLHFCSGESIMAEINTSVLDVLESSADAEPFDPMTASRVVEDVMRKISQGEEEYEPDFDADEVDESPDEVEEDIGANISPESSENEGDANQSMDAIRMQAAASIDALLEANSQLINAYKKGSAVDFVFKDGYAGDEPATAESENRAAFAAVDTQAVTIAKAPEAHDSKEAIFPQEVRTGSSNADHWTSVLRAEFRNLWTEDIAPTPRAGITYNVSESTAPTYFAWPPVPPKAAAAAAAASTTATNESITPPLPPASTEETPVPQYPDTGADTWVSEYDGTYIPSGGGAPCGGRGPAGVQGVSTSSDPPFFAYPTVEVRQLAPKPEKVSQYTVPSVCSESRGSFFWNTDIQRPSRKVQPSVQAPLVHDARLLDSSLWSSEYDAQYAEPINIGLGGITITSAAGTSPQADYVLPVPAGGSPKKEQLGRGKKRFADAHENETPFGLDEEYPCEPESAEYGRELNTLTVAGAGLVPAKTEALVGAGASVNEVDTAAATAGNDDGDEDDEDDEEYTADPEWLPEEFEAELELELEAEAEAANAEEKLDAAAVAEVAAEAAVLLSAANTVEKTTEEPRYGRKAKYEPPLWVHGKAAPKAVDAEPPAVPEPKVTPSVLLPPYAIDPLIMASALNADKKGMIVVGRALSAKEVSRLVELTKAPKEKKSGKKIIIPKYKSFDGPNRAIKFADKYGRGQARAASLAANRAYKDNRKGRPSAVLFNPRYPRQTDKQSKRWGTENKSYGAKPKRSLK